MRGGSASSSPATSTHCSFLTHPRFMGGGGRRRVGGRRVGGQCVGERSVDGRRMGGRWWAGWCSRRRAGGQSHVPGGPLALLAVHAQEQAPLDLASQLARAEDVVGELGANGRALLAMHLGARALVDPHDESGRCASRRGCQRAARQRPTRQRVVRQRAVRQRAARQRAAGR